MSRLGIAEVLEEQDFNVILCVGCREDGRIQLAAVAQLRTLPTMTYDVLAKAVVECLDRLYRTPLDDLERRDGEGRVLSDE